MKRLTDPKFKYVPAAATDIRKTFSRVRREMKEAEEAKAQQTNIKALKRITA